MDKKHLLVGCSFTDPTWQSDIPWSILYSKVNPSYIVAKAGMGINGICTEAMYYIENLNISNMVIVLPTLWRMDIEVDEETYLCNAMVELAYADDNYNVVEPAKRKWIISGGLHYPKDTEFSKIFDFLYKHQGFLVILKEHIRALTRLLNYCKMHNIEYKITAIQDPLEQLVGLDYIRENVIKLLNSVEYNNWIRFNGEFINKFLGHEKHPTTEEHVELCKHILINVNS